SDGRGAGGEGAFAGFMVPKHVRTQMDPLHEPPAPLNYNPALNHNLASLPKNIELPQPVHGAKACENHKKTSCGQWSVVRGLSGVIRSLYSVVSPRVSPPLSALLCSLALFVLCSPAPFLSAPWSVVSGPWSVVTT